MARLKFRHSLRFPRAGKFWPGSRGNPRKWGPGKGEYERGALILSRPRRRFGSFAAVGKGTRRPQAAKFPLRDKIQRGGGGKPPPYRILLTVPVPENAPSSAPVCVLRRLPRKRKACGRHILQILTVLYTGKNSFTSVTRPVILRAQQERALEYHPWNKIRAPPGDAAQRPYRKTLLETNRRI